MTLPDIQTDTNACMKTRTEYKKVENIYDKVSFAVLPLTAHKTLRDNQGRACGISQPSARDRNSPRTELFITIKPEITDYDDDLTLHRYPECPRRHRATLESLGEIPC